MKTSNVAEIGFTVLYELEDEVPEVDIVFIHGLQGHPKDTWLWRGENADLNAPPGKHKRFSLSRSRRRLFKSSGANPKLVDETSSSTPPQRGGSTSTNRQSEQGVYWPVDLLPEECPHSRILTWGYDSRVTRSYAATSKNNLFGHARDFMYGYERRHPVNRGIIFVAHSLGGLIVKEVLRRCGESNEAEFQNILSSTQAVVFLGTPHRGSPDFASMAEVVRNLGSTILRFDSNETMIRVLGVDAPELELSRESFISQWGKLQFTVKTFQEAQPLSGVGIGILNKKVVPDISSILDDPREHAETIPANHMDMCRYSGRTDPGYQKVGRELERLARRKNLTRPYSPSTKCPSNRQELVGNCIRALQFGEMTHRRNAIRAPLTNTCQWALSHPEYLSWEHRLNVETTHGMLRVGGVPGSGKSTIMKEMVRRTQLEAAGARLVLSFYHNARGSDLEYSPIGMLRSILQQLLQYGDAFEKVILSHYEETRHTKTKSWIPQLRELQQLTRHCLVDARYDARVTIFVDALDECGERDAREMAYFFRELTDDAFYSGLQLDICISCRYYPHITFPHCPSICVEQANRDDISTYVNTMISYELVADNKIIDDLRSTIIEKSNGIFLWVVLVVRMVMRDLDVGCSGSEIQNTISNIPSDLEDMFNNLLETIPINHRKRAFNLTNWVLLGETPLRIEHIPVIDTLGTFETSDQFIDLTRKKNPSFLSDLTTDTSRLERLVREISRGLIEISGGIVQFIHETVREFIIINGYRIFGFPTADTSSFLVLGHCMVIRSCIRGLALPELPLNQFEIVNLSLSGRGRDWMCSYITNHLQTHIDRALQHYAFPLKIVYLIGLTLRVHESNHFSLFKPGWIPTHCGDKYFSKILSDLDNYCSVTLQHFSSEYADQAPALEVYRRLRSFPYSLTFISNGLKSKMKQERYYKLEQEHIIQDIDQNIQKYRVRYFTDNENNTLLHLSALMGMERLTEYLINSGVPVETHNSLGWTALHVACLFGYSGVVRILLNKGSNPSDLSLEGYTALHIAVENERTEVTQLLLKAMSKKYVNIRNSYGRTALHLAARYTMNSDIVRVLLENGADRTIVDEDGDEPRKTALDRTNNIVARMLGNRSSDWESDSEGESDLEWETDLEWEPEPGV